MDAWKLWKARSVKRCRTWSNFISLWPTQRDNRKVNHKKTIVKNILWKGSLKIDLRFIAPGPSNEKKFFKQLVLPLLTARAFLTKLQSDESKYKGSVTHAEPTPPLGTLLAVVQVLFTARLDTWTDRKCSRKMWCILLSGFRWMQQPPLTSVALLSTYRLDVRIRILNKFSIERLAIALPIC